MTLSTAIWSNAGSAGRVLETSGGARGGEDLAALVEKARAFRNALALRAIAMTRA